MELLGVEDKSESERILILKTFSEKNVATKSFEISLPNRKLVWSGLFKVIKNSDLAAVKLEGIAMNEMFVPRYVKSRIRLLNLVW